MFCGAQTLVEGKYCQAIFFSLYFTFRILNGKSMSNVHIIYMVIPVLRNWLQTLQFNPGMECLECLCILAAFSIVAEAFITWWFGGNGANRIEEEYITYNAAVTKYNPSLQTLSLQTIFVQMPPQQLTCWVVFEVEPVAPNIV